MSKGGQHGWGRPLREISMSGWGHLISSTWRRGDWRETSLGSTPAWSHHQAWESSRSVCQYSWAQGVIVGAVVCRARILTLQSLWVTSNSAYSLILWKYWQYYFSQSSFDPFALWFQQSFLHSDRSSTLSRS